MTLELSHLVVNGCSMAYCQGLDDPTTEGWPALLAAKLGVPVVNIAVRGSGNGSIYRRTYEYFFKSKKYNAKPLYIVGMSQSHRREEFLQFLPGEVEVNDYYNISFRDGSPMSEMLYANYNATAEQFAEVQKRIHWSSIKNLFVANNIPYIMTDLMGSGPPMTDRLTQEFSELYDDLESDLHTLPNISSTIIKEKLPLLPCQHWASEANILIAELFYQKLISVYSEIIPINTINNQPVTFPTLKDYWPESRILLFTNEWFRKDVPNYMTVLNSKV